MDKLKLADFVPPELRERFKAAFSEIDKEKALAAIRLYALIGENNLNKGTSFISAPVAVRRAVYYSYAGKTTGYDFGIPAGTKAWSTRSMTTHAALISHGASINDAGARAGFVDRLGSEIADLGVSNGLEDVYYGIMSLPGVAGSEAGETFHKRFSGAYDEVLAKANEGETFYAANMSSGEVTSHSVSEFASGIGGGMNLTGTSFMAAFDKSNRYAMGGGGESFGRTLAGFAGGVVVAAGVFVAAGGPADPWAGVAASIAAPYGEKAGRAVYDYFNGGDVDKVEAGAVNQLHQDLKGASNTNKGNTNNGNTNDGNTNDGNTNNGNTNNGNTNTGNTNSGNTNNGNTNNGNVGGGTATGSGTSGNTNGGGSGPKDPTEMVHPAAEGGEGPLDPDAMVLDDGTTPIPSDPLFWGTDAMLIVRIPTVEFTFSGTLSADATVLNAPSIAYANLHSNVGAVGLATRATTAMGAVTITPADLASLTGFR